MNELDNLLVEYFHDLGRNDGEYVVESPGDVWYNLSEVRGETGKARNTINRRMGGLVDAGLLERVTEGRYRITDLGWRLAEDELSGEERERLKGHFL